MRKLAGVLFSIFLLASAARAQSVFNGTWQMDLKHAIVSARPEVFSLRNGIFACQSCTPAFTVKADGADQPVVGRFDADSVAVKIINDHEIEQTIKKRGKLVFKGKLTVSADGTTLDRSFTVYPPNGAPTTSSNKLRRLDRPVPGAHAITGSWGGSILQELPGDPRSWTFSVNGDEFTSTSDKGVSYTARLNGPEVPVKGNGGATSVALKLVDKNTLEETYKRNGKIVAVTQMRVDEGGRTAMCTQKDPSGWSVQAPCLKQIAASGSQADPAN